MSVKVLRNGSELNAFGVINFNGSATTSTTTTSTTTTSTTTTTTTTTTTSTTIITTTTSTPTTTTIAVTTTHGQFPSCCVVDGCYCTKEGLYDGVIEIACASGCWPNKVKGHCYYGVWDGIHYCKAVSLFCDSIGRTHTIEDCDELRDDWPPGHMVAHIYVNDTCEWWD